MEKYDFSGWATRNNLKCTDGRVIMNNAFKHNDGRKVPLVWNHQHNDPHNVLGYALLENREEEGMFAYGVFNETDSAQAAKLLVQHGDVTSLSIWANRLQEKQKQVFHGDIREVSLVLAGANPGAKIESIMKHEDGSDEEAIIFNDREDLVLSHADKSEPEEPAKEPEPEKKKEEEPVANEDKTVQEVFDTLTEEQKTVVYAMIAAAMDGDDQEDDEEENDEEETPDMKHNVFDRQEEEQENVIAHTDMMAVLNDAKRFGSLKESALQHGITDIEFLFPDAQNVTPTPTWIDRDQTWVDDVMSNTHHTPFSRIKSMAADITADEARAKGYTKNKKKMDEVFTLLKRVTTPATVYKKQSLDRDDVIDITDFDVIAWLKVEMRGKLNEELARAVLISDGRLSSDEDKINETNIRPIWTDDDLYAVKVNVDVAANATADEKAKATIRAIIKSRKEYKGSGNPTFYTTEDVLTDMLLLEDGQGRVIYDTIEKLTTALRVKKIVTVAPMENKTREAGGKTLELLGIVVNLKDYTIGADKGGAVNMFDDFDIDYNKMKYLIETRCSGALVLPHSALVLERETA